MTQSGKKYMLKQGVGFLHTVSRNQGAARSITNLHSISQTRVHIIIGRALIVSFEIQHFYIKQAKKKCWSLIVGHDFVYVENSRTLCLNVPMNPCIFLLLGLANQRGSVHSSFTWLYFMNCVVVALNTINKNKNEVQAMISKPLIPQIKLALDRF